MRAGKGIVYERIEGATLLHLAAAAQSPEELYRIILSFAGLHYSIHSSEPEAVEIQTSAASIMRQKHALAGNICNAPLRNTTGRSARGGSRGT